MCIDQNELIVRGIELMSQEKYAEAKEVFAVAVQHDRKNLAAYLDLGNACINNGDINDGISAFKRALLIDKDSTEALYSLGCAYFMIDDYANSLRYFNRVEAQGNATVEMYQILMAMFVDSDNIDMAVRSANRAIQLAPLDVALRINKAELYVLQNKTKEAVASLKELQEILPDEVIGYAMEAEVLIGANDEINAIEAIDRVIMRFPQDASLLAIKARAQNGLGQYKEALYCAEKAYEIGSMDASVVQDIILQRGIALGGLGRVNDSIEVLEESAGDSVNAVMAYYTLMNECIMVEEYERGELYSRRIIEMGEKVEGRIRAAAEFCLAMSVQRQGRIEEAHELYKDVTRDLRRMNILNPGMFEAYVYRVVAHREIGEYDKALDLCNHLIALDGGTAPSFALKYEVLDAKGDEFEALKYKERVLKLDPNYKFGVHNG